MTQVSDSQNFSRRHIVAGTGAAALWVASTTLPSAAFAVGEVRANLQGSGDHESASLLEELLKLGDDPYVKAGVFVFNVFSGIGGFIAQQRTDRALDEIKTALVEINKKLDLIIKQFENIGNTLRDADDKSKSREFELLLYAQSTMITNVASNYSAKSLARAAFTADDKKEIKDRARRVLTDTWNQKSYGDDGHIRIAAGYQFYYWAVKFAKLKKVGLEDARIKAIEEMKMSLEYCRNKIDTEKKKFAAEVADLDSVERSIYVSMYGVGMATLVVRYVEVRGNTLNGFSRGDIKFSDGTFGKSPKDAHDVLRDQGIATKYGFEENIADRIIQTLNENAARIRKKFQEPIAGYDRMIKVGEILQKKVAAAV